MSALFNVAGGVRYHLRGLRHSRRRWRPFRDELGAWLAGWRRSGEKLVIIGASGGYCLRMDWLSGFQEVVCLDPDPLARVIFERHLRAAAPHTRLTWSNENFLESRDPGEQLRRLRSFLDRHPEAPVLFSNFLGQLNLLMHEHRQDASAAMATWKARLIPDVLAGRAWASFHDRVSGQITPSLERPLIAPSRLTDEQLVSRLYPDPTGVVELVDHDTVGLFPEDREHAYFSWRLTSAWTHLIEAVRS